MTGGTERQPTHDRSPAWFERSFGDRYRLLYGHRDDAAARREIAALVDTMNLRPPLRVLDVCCGAGRHLEAMRQAGFDAWGVDLSPQLLADASNRDGVSGRVVRGDIRTLPFDGAFDAAVNLFTSFGYFQSDAENIAALLSIVRTLKRGGVLALDHAHRAFVERTLKPRTVEQRGDATITASRRIKGDRVTKQTTVEIGGTTEQFVESVRLYRPDEMKAMFAAAGMAEVRIVGAFDGRVLDADSDRMITLGRRA